MASDTWLAVVVACNALQTGCLSRCPDARNSLFFTGFPVILGLGTAIAL